MRSPVIGIDLGTTGSLVAVVRDGRPEILSNLLGERITPSAVSVLDDGALVVGAAARARASTHPDRTVVQFKRDMGTPRQYDLAGVRLRPVALSALLLKELKVAAEEHLGASVTDAVITVPAYFGEDQRHATREAGRLAGLRVLRVLNEPTAAALAYGLDNLGHAVKAVVLDIGGGTFDVTVLQLADGIIDVRGCAGDARLGGEDFTDALVPLLLDGLEAAPGDMARAREAADRAKLGLTDAERVEVSLDGLVFADGSVRDVRRALTRQEAEQAWLPLLARVREPIERALRDARWRLEDVEEVLLVGGATRMPVVRRLAARLFGRPPRHDLHPDEVVALGAAVQGAMFAGDAAVEELVATDIAPFSLGVAVTTPLDGLWVPDRFHPIIERGTVIPASREHPFQAAAAGQTSVLIQVYQGDHPVASKNTFLGDLLLEDMPISHSGFAYMKVRFTYDLSGLLEVDCSVRDGTTRSLVLVGSASRLSDDEIEAVRESLQRLKIHPRELLPNATAVARAEALYGQLVGAQRAQVGDALLAFEVALASQDPERILRVRRSLEALIHALQGA